MKDLQCIARSIRNTTLFVLSLSALGLLFWDVKEIVDHYNKKNIVVVHAVACIHMK